MLKRFYKCIFLSTISTSLLAFATTVDFTTAEYKNIKDIKYEYDNKNTYTFDVNKTLFNRIEEKINTYDNSWKAHIYQIKAVFWGITNLDVKGYDFYGWNIQEFLDRDWMHRADGWYKKWDDYKIQYLDNGTITNRSSTINYSNAISLPNTTFNKNYQLVFNFSNGSSIKVNSNMFSNGSLNGYQDILFVEKYDGDGLIPNHNYNIYKYQPTNDWYKWLIENLANYNYINYGGDHDPKKPVPIPNYQNSRNDSFTIECQYKLNIIGNTLHYDLNFTGIAANEGNQNVYQFQNQTFNLELVNIQVKPLNYNLINETQLQNNLDKIFNSPLSLTVDNDNKLSSNQEAIKKTVDERLHEQYKLLDYYYNNSNWFKWNIELFNDDKKTIIIKFSYKLFYTNNNSDETGWNYYSVEAKVDIKSSDKYYATEIWKRFLVGNTKISYDPIKGVSMEPAIKLGINNPWYALNQQPYPQSTGNVNYPDFGTWYINTNTTINYHSLPNENEIVADGQ